MNTLKIARKAFILPVIFASACAVTGPSEDQVAVQSVPAETAPMIKLEMVSSTTDERITSDEFDEQLPVSGDIEQHVSENLTVIASGADPETDTQTTDLLDEPSLESDVATMDVIVTPPPATTVFYFETNKSDIVAEDLLHLSEHAAFLSANPEATLVISGHADMRGSTLYNEVLSKKRADAVVEVLLQFGAPENQILVQSFGEDAPLNERNRWDENRRVELDYELPTQLTQR